MAPGVHWLSHCQDIAYRGLNFHNQTGTFLILGTEKTMLVDTGRPGDWPYLDADLDKLLAGRTLDFVAPTHAELPHCGNLPRLGQKYPDIKIVGDVRDYHLFYPDLVGKLLDWPKHEPIDLGGGYALTLIEAVIRDMNHTQWMYESKTQTMFVSDGFACLHHSGPAGVSTVEQGEAVHTPGECALLTSQLTKVPEPYQATKIVEAALWWARYRPSEDLFAQMDALLERYPTKFIAPSHGNVIDQVEKYVPIMNDALAKAIIA
jgi:flavorubredoxin